MKQELTISSGKAQLLGMTGSILGVLMLWFPFQWFWGGSLRELESLPWSVWVTGLLLLIIGILVHEGIHGLTAVYYGKISWQETRFGVQWKSLTPYFHSTVPMAVEKYRIVVIMPLLVLGLIPYLGAMLLGNTWLLAFGITFTISAFGDLLILWMMRKIPPQLSVQDHPSKVGLLINA